MKDIFGREFRVGLSVVYARIVTNRVVLEKREVAEVGEDYLKARPIGDYEWSIKRAGRISPDKCVVVETTKAEDVLNRDLPLSEKVQRVTNAHFRRG